MTSDADWLREVITTLGTSQTALAKELQIDARVVRRWAAGREKVPHIARLAIEHLMMEKQRGAKD